MRVLILSRNRQLFSIRRLLDEARKLRMECEVVDPLDCQIVVAHRKNKILVRGKPLPPIDVVIPRIGTSITDHGIALVRQFELMGVKVLNGGQGISDSRDKFRCLQILANKGHDVPATVLTRGSQSIRSSLGEVNGTPAVIKLLRGTQGMGVMLAEGLSSAESVMDTMWELEQDVLLQEFIAESSGRDIRAFVIGNKIVASMRRHAKPGDFRSNIHRGGNGMLIELKPQYKNAAVKAVRAIGLTVAGVDMLESHSGPKIIEVNSSPGFEGIEAVTGLNIARMILLQARRLKRKKTRKKTRKKKVKRNSKGSASTRRPKRNKSRAKKNNIRKVKGKKVRKT